MGLLLTTSKGGRGARELCRSLASILPGAVCENRGGKTVGDVVERARLLGKRRIAFIHSKGGKASELHFARVGANSWDWLEPVFILKSAKATPMKERPECAKLTGACAPQWRELLGIADSGPSGDAVTLECGKKSVKFTLSRKTAAELVFE